MIRVLVIGFIGLLISQSSFSQEIIVIINGEQGDRPLTFKDFKGRANEQSPFDAETGAAVSCDYTKLKLKGDSIMVDGAVVRVEMVSNKSWRKKGKESDALLKHEQGHFDMKKIWGMTLKKAFDTACVPRKGYLYYLNSISSEINKKYMAMDVLYDKETEHGKNITEQEKWNQFFKDNLPA